jgi:hypothetical protein
MHLGPKGSCINENKEVKCIWRLNADNLPSKRKMKNQRRKFKAILGIPFQTNRGL